MSIEFVNVDKKFADAVALDSISFRIESGTACGYIGPNGAGKTTTARIIVGLEKVDSGTLRITDKEPPTDFAAVQKHVGYVPESPRLYESLSPHETIAMAAMLRKYDTAKAISKFRILSEMFHFENYLKRPISGLSKGTRQKVVISLALLFNPDILVLDEPTDGLDVQAVLSLKQIIKVFTAQGGTVFYSSHLLDIVEGVCSQVYFINHGKIAGKFKKEEFEGQRGYLENALVESIGTKNEQQLINAFFDDAD
ncbi:MAG: ABC transporter ATP-binding protein [Bacteroidetes bacterium]|nr:ABC transporter ATP-binding protein [Bacteroidota bacterium]